MRRKDNNDELKEALEIIDLETFLDYEGVDYKRTFGSSGTQLNIKTCPRCGGSEWKVYMNAESGLGNCFHGSCVGEPGYNVYSFATHLWNLPGKDTVERLKAYAKEQGWVAKRTTSFAFNDTKVDFNLPDNVLLPYKDTIPKYLECRGITHEIVKFFGLRYCSKGVYLYTDENGKSRWQSYDKRIIIPVFDLEGDLVTFQGRDITGKSGSKYLFPPGLPGTARYLYNGHNAIGAEEIVIGEGAFDVFSIKMALDEQMSLRRIVAVGSFGKKLSSGSSTGDDQLGALVQLKRHGLKRVVMMWDGEASALRAAIDAAKLIKSVGLEVKIAVLPEDKDPNEVTAGEIRAAYFQALRPTSAELFRVISKRRSN